MDKSKLIIAIDGPSGAGKSTIASMFARRLGVPYLDTGAMYRTVALVALRRGVGLPIDDQARGWLAELEMDGRLEVDSTGGSVRVVLDGEDVSEEIRTPECSQMASAVSAIPAVRSMLVRLQQSLGRRGGGVVEGRDIGTVVFPDADLKVFLTASEVRRAERRAGDLHRQGRDVSVDDVRVQQRERDHRDTTRADSPLQVARGAVVVDSSEMSPEEVVERLLRELENSLDSRGRNP